MPNHISNRLTIKANPARIKEVFAAIAGKYEDGKKRLIDFNTLIPYPERYRELDKAASDFVMDNPDASYDLRPKDGYNQGGYEWCRDNWGTKWNAYEQKRLSASSIYFETAWSAPRPIMDALAEKFPDVFFKLEYCDEDMTGNNAGMLLYKDGKKNEGEMSGACATQLWFDLNPKASPEEHEMDPDLLTYQ